MSAENLLITEEMLARYYDLNKMKKEIDAEMSQLKTNFHAYMDEHEGINKKGELVEGKYKLIRQIRKSEKFHEKDTVALLEEMQLDDLIKVVKKPDDGKINAAIELGLLAEENLEDCRIASYSPAIAVKKL
ncbi:hypothetical protein [Oceanobacillus damuensis]|uniref:hypothetical protein n=1 Tax=Oceanobacillus damuensis TaxID=937928 RepID=UPI00082D84FB|nr:hypothetical protein [Oceanobacillus damuensis]